MSIIDDSPLEIDEDVELYIELNFSHNMKCLIKDCFKLLTVYQQDADINGPFIEMLALNEIDMVVEVKDNFIAQLEAMLDALLNAHSIVVNQDEITLHDRYKILKVLFDIQYLDSYHDILAVLESDNDAEEKLGEILRQHCELNTADVDRLIMSIDPLLFDRLKGTIYQSHPELKINYDNDNEKNKEIISNIKLLKEFVESKFKDHVPVGIQLVLSYIKIGSSFQLYIPYIENIFEDPDYKTNIEALALDLLSVIIISSDGFKDPLAVYRENSNRLLDGIDLISAVNSSMITLQAQFENFKVMRKDIKTHE